MFDAMGVKYVKTADNFCEALISGAEELRKGNIIAYPTETVYGFGVDIFNIQAVKNLYSLKKRPGNNPLSANIYSLEQARELCDEIPDIFYKLAGAFLPGPLSLVLKKKKEIPDIVTAGLDTISLRMPDNKVLTGILKNFNGIMAGTSANISGGPAFRSGGEILQNIHEFESLPGISLIIDDGPGRIGIESTVLSIAGDKLQIFREGAIKCSEIEKITGTKIIPARIGDGNQLKHF